MHLAARLELICLRCLTSVAIALALSSLVFPIGFSVDRIGGEVGQTEEKGGVCVGGIAGETETDRQNGRTDHAHTHTLSHTHTHTRTLTHTHM